ncbi:MAG: phospho-2-dehydro-3-deoxyheptonate aldolase, partial [Deltaproteobacteria bacterium]|nr:phospho-2-dehydro-3-deoxyheptonate aldolase [Deltaproteobacteria bacterium]
MIIVLKANITQEEKNRILSLLHDGGCIVREMSEAGQGVIGTTGNAGYDIEFFEKMSGVEKVVPISTSFKLVSRQMHPEDSIVDVGDVAVGGERIVVIAGPCAVESSEQALTIAQEVRKYGAILFRGGAFKPRSSPYSFQGLGEEGLKILAEVRERVGLRVVTEITSPSQA